jgi:Tfp pilus assembly protein PilE
VDLPKQRGSTLAETAVAVAIVAIVAGTTLGASLTAIHGAARGSVADALQEAAARELRIALNVLKYGDATLAPASIATTLPLPAGSPLPAQLSVSTATHTDGTLLVTITAAAADGSGKHASLSAELDRRAVLPGTQILAPGLAPAPTGAP